MVKDICKDIMLLSQKAKPATEADVPLAMDLLDTLRANSERCVGMAANMIGEPKAIIAVVAGPAILLMLNPVITAKSGVYQTEESCLSLAGSMETSRYQTIEVDYQDIGMNKRHGSIEGWTAQIIQHECDHLEGILI